MAIAYCKIFPPIGIARLGNSEEKDGFFIAPEGIVAPPEKSTERHYKDAKGAVLRQAARFRIYGFDNKGKVVREITAEQAEITWTVALANKKASWYEFQGAESAQQQIDDPKPPRWPLRNASVDTKDRARLLNIDPGKPVVISGKNTAGTDDEPGKYAFGGKFQDVADVYLGELRTDKDGRLLVLGGRGHSAAIDKNGKDISGSTWITNYANNDFWHDDTSDGWVNATVKLGGRPVRVKGRAWVLVTPPDFAPDVPNLVTLYDVMEEVALTSGKSHPGLPAPQGATAVEFWRDIYPLLVRAMGYRWVNDLGLRGHGHGKPGDFSDPDLLESLSDPDDERGRQQRRRIFARIRTPKVLQRDSELAKKQATQYFMPPLSGDQGNSEAGKPATWLTVTPLQYRRLEAWANDQFTPGKRTTTVPRAVANEPALLTRTTLEACAGGAFYPGIEMSSIARCAKLYGEAFRLADWLEPGDITKFMALPWQADFYECNTSWWPAQRPDSVITGRSVTEIETAFDYERGKGDLERLMFTRQPWARGVGVVRPDMAQIQNDLFPAPNPRETLVKYIDRIRGKLGETFATVVDAIAPSNDILPERIPSPRRVQYLAQEQFDIYGGRYFHFGVPSPDEFLATKANAKHAERGSDRAKRVASEAAKFPDAWQLSTGVDSAEYRKLITDYLAYIKKRAAEYCGQVLQALAKGHRESKPFYQDLLKLLNTNADDYESRIDQDFDQDSSYFRELRFLEMAQAAIDIKYRILSDRAGDNDMVTMWSTLGFVVEKTITAPHDPKGKKTVRAQVETERARYHGLQYRDYYYLLSNIEQYPEMYEYCGVLVEEFLQQTRAAIEKRKSSDAGTVETFFDYKPETFAAKLEEIYEYYRQQAVETKPWEDTRTFDEIVKGRVRSAPFNQNDGAWLRFIANAGPSDEVRGLLFEIWSDEFGNGDPALHHGNLFTALLRSLNVYLPEVTSREYVDYPAFRDSDFANPVFQLAISQQADRYFPEILGMSLFLEWEVLQLEGFIKIYDYFGINSQFWRMHVGIDNAVEGHGAKARKAIEIYLDHVLRESGEQAMQHEWKRIWTGFVAFATAGSGYLGSDDDVAARRPPSIQDQMIDMIGRKQHYGSLNHGDKSLGANRINDLFDDPAGFLNELAHSAWVTPGDPDSSRLINYLTTFEGPMYKIFSPDDLTLWRKWIIWLGQEGDTSVVKRYQTKAESMLVVLQELRNSAMGTGGHMRYKLGGKALNEWFSGDLLKLMRELAKPGNEWVVPWDAGRSPLVRDFAAGNRNMGMALNQRFPGAGNQIGRLIIVRWINAGCPIPGAPIPKRKDRPAMRPESDQRRTLVEAYGQGYVH